jgi:3-deoxy-D-manno-octulosonic-acid transferase
MAGALARALYTALLVALTPLYLARLWWRGKREPRYRKRVAARLGWYDKPVPPAPTLWLHAVSLGETQAAAPLIKALRLAQPEVRVLLTCGTATGWEAGRALLRKGDLHTWLPYDTPGAVRRFLRQYRPTVGVLMETEIWPNLLHVARRHGVPMVLANARLSEKSLRSGMRLALLMRPAVLSITRVLAQTTADAERFDRIGAHDVQICGNLKFDVAPAPDLLARGLTWHEALGRAVVLAASTREGEEVPLLNAWATHPSPRPLLLLVPRHPQRFDEVAAAVHQAGLLLARRSEWALVPPPEATRADVWLGDSMGEMPMYYAAADVALLGGSFAPLGGQNLIEAAACGCPVVMGPHTFNFAEAAELSLSARASLRVKDLHDGVELALSLASDPKLDAWVDRAFTFAAAHRGATERSVAQIVALLRAPAAG